MDPERSAAGCLPSRVEERRADEDVQSLDIYTTSLTADSEDIYTTAWTTDSEDAGGRDEEPCGPPPPRLIRRADECAAAHGGAWIRRPSDPHLRCSAGDGETDEGGWVHSYFRKFLRLQKTQHIGCCNSWRTSSKRLAPVMKFLNLKGERPRI